MGKGSGRRKEDTKKVEENISKVKFGTLKPSKEWEIKRHKTKRECK